MLQENQKNILLVEDEFIITMTVKMALEKYGYVITTADSGEQAIKLVETSPTVNLILMDIDLGQGMDGTQAAAIILQNHDIPIVFLSSHTEPDIVEKTEKVASYGYVVKISNITVLDASIKMAFRLFEAKTNAKNKELLLARQEKFLRTVLHTSVDGFWVFGMDWKFSDVNEAYLRMSGYSRDELLSLGIMDVDAKMTLAEAQAQLDSIVREGSGVFETRHRAKSGRVFDVEISVTHLDIDGGKLICFCRDITERKKTDAALRDGLWRMAGIIEGTHVGTWEWNVQTGETVFSPVWAELIGYTLEELGPANVAAWERFGNAEDRKNNERQLRRHFSGELPYYEVECRMRHKDGHWVWIKDRGKVVSWSDDGKPLLMFGIHADITERKLTENLLRTL